MSKDRSKGIVGIFVLITVLFVIFMIFAFYTLSTVSSSKGNNSTSLESRKAPIAIIEVEGVIMESKKAVKKLLTAERDKSVKAIIVRIDSPGGAVGPTQEIYEEMRRIDKKIPVYASFGTVAASGGYYLGAGARQIYANAGTMTGSIGVIMNFMDLSKLYELAKVKPQIIKAGLYKDIGSTSREMTGVERKILTDMTLNVHEQFISDILATRKDKIVKGEAGLREYAQGQIFSGAGAQKLGLVDKIGGLYKLARDIHKELKFKNDFSVKYIKLKRDLTFSEIVNGIEESVKDINYQVRNNYVPMMLYKP